MSRSFCIPGILFIFCAFVLSIIVSISLPYLPDIDIVRTHITSGSVSTTINGGTAVDQIRLGIWAFCTEDVGGSRTCSPTEHAYSVPISASSGNNHAGITVNPSWTRGLAVHPVATAVTFIALIFSFSTHLTVTLIASLLSALAALLTFIAFLIDIALLAWMKHEMKHLTDDNVGVSETTYTAPGFWMTFVTLILLMLGSCTVCFGRRRDRMAGATYTDPEKAGWRSRFRRT